MDLNSLDSHHLSMYYTFLRLTTINTCTSSVIPTPDWEITNIAGIRGVIDPGPGASPLHLISLTVVSQLARLSRLLQPLLMRSSEVIAVITYCSLLTYYHYNILIHAKSNKNIIVIQLWFYFILGIDCFMSRSSFAIRICREMTAAGVTALSKVFSPQVSSHYSRT